MSNSPSVPEDTLPNPLVTPAAPAQHDCSAIPGTSPRHHSRQAHLSQGSREVPSPSRAESPTAHSWSQPRLALKRTATTPPENTAIPDIVYRPQLSERDSIFATHYLPSDSGANTPQLPPERALDTERQVNLIPSLDDAPVSPSAFPKVSPHRLNVDPSHMEVDVHRHSPLRSSTLFSPDAPRLSLLRATTSPIDHFKNPGAEVGVQAHLGGSYRYKPPLDGSGTNTSHFQGTLPERNLFPSALDDVSPTPHSLSVLSGQGSQVSQGFGSYSPRKEATLPSLERSPSRGRRGGRVDSSIEANLTNAEPASNVRSRKSSHYLGLFKENTTSPDRKRREDRGRPQDETLEAQDRVMDLEQEPQPRSEEEASIRKSISLPSLGDAPSLELAHSETLQTKQHDDLHKRPPPVLPRSLLEEIRNFHLTPGGRHGSSFSKSIPTQYSERKRDYFDKNVHVEISPTNSFEQEERRGSQQFGVEEDENEQISSAVYFPHERTVPEGVETLQQYPEDPHGVQPVQLTVPEKGHELMLVPQERNSPEKEISHVDISLRSKNESKILYGDIHSPRENLPEKPLSTISETSYDSAHESEPLSADEYQDSATEDGHLTDEAETPTATPKQRPRILSHHKPPGPLGAVELKPYRHQVGGHTTVFRFSRRAVCKQLNNRENEFYERIELRHPDMLVFLPK
jgi:inositol-hexakisphosphate kinase